MALKTFELSRSLYLKKITMKGVTIIETETLNALIGSIEDLKHTVLSTIAELKTLKDPYMTTQEVAAYTKFGKKWVQDNKDKIGRSMPGNHCRFKRSDVEAFMEDGYYKIKKRT
jgi:excisionase family DNA binding protein